MLHRRAVLLSAAILLSTEARAKTSLQAQLTASAGWSDNILSSPDNAPGLPPPTADWLFEIRPGVLLATGSSRAVQTLGYTLTGTLFAKHSEADSYSQRLEWNGFFATSKTTELLLRAALSQGQLHTFNLSAASSDGTTIGVTIPGSQQEFFGATASENFAWDITPQWRFFQTLLFNSYFPWRPRIAPDSYEIDQHLIAERAWRHDAIGLDVRLDFTVFTQLGGPSTPSIDPMTGMLLASGQVSPERDVMINGAVAKWKHDFGNFWNIEGDLGFVETNLARNGRYNIWQPAALAAARYLHPSGSVELSYAHNVTPNAIIASVLTIDQAALRGTLPLGPADKTHLSLSATVAYQYSRALDFTTGQQVSHTNVILADATLYWALRKEIAIFARYQFFDQIGSPTDFAPLPSFHKDVIMIGATGLWPGEAAAVVPTRQALRVDRGDAVAIPEPHSEPPKY
jgi:hypothetical protein